MAKKGALIICEYYNITADYTVDTTTRYTCPLPMLQSILYKEDLYDVWRCQHSNKHDYTFHSSRHNSYSCLDIIIVDRNLLQAVSSSTIHNILWSDHTPVWITVMEENTPSHVYVWQANSNLLQMPSYVTSLTNHLKEYFVLNTESVSDPTTLWYAHKVFIRGIILQIS